MPLDRPFFTLLASSGDSLQKDPGSVRWSKLRTEFSRDRAHFHLRMR